MSEVLRLYHGSPEESFVPTFGLGNEKRNPLRRTFDNLLEEGA